MGKGALIWFYSVYQAHKSFRKRAMLNMDIPNRILLRKNLALKKINANGKMQIKSDSNLIRNK